MSENVQPEGKIDAQKQEGNDEPRDQVNTKRVVELGRVSVRRGDAGSWDQDGREGHPERSVRCES
jgi:hypothetical protein